MKIDVTKPERRKSSRRRMPTVSKLDKDPPKGKRVGRDRRTVGPIGTRRVDILVENVMRHLATISLVDLEHVALSRCHEEIDKLNAAMELILIETLHADNHIACYPHKVDAYKEWPEIRRKLAFNALYITIQRRLFDSRGAKIGPKT